MSRSKVILLSVTVLVNPVPPAKQRVSPVLKVSFVPEIKSPDMIPYLSILVNGISSIAITEH